MHMVVLQLTSSRNTLRACSTRQAAVEYSAVTMMMRKVIAYFLVVMIMTLTFGMKGRGYG